jgi:NDP-sugar pyrophosphorylase family protein
MMTKWTDIGAIAATWEKDEYGWQIAPIGLDWIDGGEGAHIGEWARIGEGARIGAGAHIGEWARIGARAHIGAGAHIGEWARIGARAHIGAGAHIGEWARIGEGARNPVDIGWADGYRKCIAEVDGVAYIGAGCRWFTLDDALAHWGNHNEDRTMTLALLESAKAIANAKSWQWSGLATARAMMGDVA